MRQKHPYKILFVLVIFFLLISPLRGNLKIESLSIGSDNIGNWWWRVVLKNDGSTIPRRMVKVRAVQLSSGPSSEAVINDPIPKNETISVRRGLIRRCSAHHLKLELWRAKYNPKAPKSPPTWVKTSLYKTIPIPPIDIVIKKLVCKPEAFVQKWGVKLKNQTPYATKITLRAQVAYAVKRSWSKAGEYNVVVPANSAVTKTGTHQGANPWSQVKVTLLYFEEPGSKSCLLDSKTVNCK
jgi:hypothetical protein